MNKNESLIKTFYTAFAKRDYKSMQKCYHDEALFFDPVFNHLQSKEVKAMWHMLCENGHDLQITYGNIGVFDNSAQVTWKAVYTFSKTGKIVLNEILAKFYFKDGLIVKHDDNFDLWKWSRMALGTPGVLFGWSGVFQDKIRKTAKKQLRQFIKTHPGYL